LTSNLLKIQKKEFPARRCPRQYEWNPQKPRRSS
jgi:hypothetical protein